MQGIVQQRDMYRALLAKQDSAALAIDSDVSVESKLDEATLKLREIERENIALSGQVERLNMHCESLSAANENLSSSLLEKSTGLAKCAATLSHAENKLHELEEDMKQKNDFLARLEVSYLLLLFLRGIGLDIFSQLNFVGNVFSHTKILGEQFCDVKGKRATPYPVTTPARTGIRSSLGNS